MKNWLKVKLSQIRDLPLYLSVVGTTLLAPVAAAFAAYDDTSQTETSYLKSSQKTKFDTTVGEIQEVIELAVEVILILVVTYAVVQFLRRFVGNANG